MIGLHSYKDVYSGKTVFIIGNGTELNGIDSMLLKDQIVIGCNNAHLWKSDCNFFIAGHAIFPMLWEQKAKVKDICIFHGLPTLKIEKVINQLYRGISSNTNLFEKDIQENSCLIGCDMVGFSATHLALIIGAKNIVYMGFDSLYPYHFYDFEPYHSTMWWDVQALKTRWQENEMLMAEIQEFEKRHLPPGDNAMGFVLKHYNMNLQKFSVLFYILKSKYNINVYATQPESITVNAGAEYKQLLELL